MLKIGDFSRLAHVSVKTLRFYARDGLLPPVWIDRFTGYRYYDLMQLPRLNRILALKDLGFSLEQIGKMLDDALSAAELRGMLRMKQAELRQHLANEQQRLARVEKRLEQIEHEGMVSANETVLRRIAPGTSAWAQTHAASDEQVEQAREGLRQVITSWCSMNHYHINGPWLTRIESGDYKETNVDIQLGVLIEEPKTVIAGKGSSPVWLEKQEEIPSAACLLGTNSAVPPLPELLRWIELNGYKACGPTRIVWLDEGLDTPFREQVVEVQIPVVCPNMEITKEIEMEPVRFGELPAFKVMGMKYRGKNEHQEIAVMWGELNQRVAEIPMVGECAYGVCLMEENSTGEFEYIAGFKVEGSVSKRCFWA